MRAASNKVLVDFLNGSGFFEGDPEAWEISQKMGKNQRRKLKRRGIVPSCFFQYLARANVIRECDIPKEPKTKGWLLDLLRFYRYAIEKARSHGEYLYREIIKGEIPWLARSFGQGDFIWDKLEES
jgi:hypothetical protein